MQCLYVGYEFKNGKTGGAVVRKNNHKLLKSINNLTIDDFFIENEKNKIALLKNYFSLSFNGGTKKIIKNFKETLKNTKYTHIFFDTSLYGVLIKYVKKNYPKMKIITFFHNIEVNYYKERVKAEGIKNIIALPSVFYNEKLSIKYSDEIIVLTDRDKKELTNKYKIEKITIIPISLEDKFDPNRKIKKSDYDYLFIGSAFFANIHGISWFIEEVLPSVPGKLVVIGKGMEILKEKYNNGQKLEILGTVEDVEKYYYEDNIVVSPIFYGAGMKTKTIEALMYGKTIIGTEEAFIGIEDIESIANNKEEFKKEIKLVKKRNNSNEISRKIYEEKYMLSKAKGKYNEIFK